ncbi:hypothetical protein JCM15908A_07950 [Prevotella dentasini JCM 15908]
MYNTLYTRDKDYKSNQDVEYLDIQDSISHFYSHYWQRTKEIEDSLNRRGNFDLKLRQRLNRPYSSGQEYHIYKGIPEKGKLTYTALQMADFKYEEEIPNLHWEIQDRDTTILEHRCQAATTTFRGRTWNVWFALDIPIPDGPWKLCGLPGLILKAEDSEGYFLFDGVGISNVNIKGIEVAKENYYACTPREHFKLYKEYLTNPIGLLRKTTTGSVMIPEEHERETDIRNNPEKLAKIVYLENYDAEDEK